jgi:hypothetical protein
MTRDEIARLRALCGENRDRDVTPYYAASEAYAALPALLDRVEELEIGVENRNQIINHWFPLLGYGCANDMAYPALGDRRATTAPLLDRVEALEEERDALSARCDTLTASREMYRGHLADAEARQAALAGSVARLESVAMAAQRFRHCIEVGDLREYFKDRERETFAALANALAAMEAP